MGVVIPNHFVNVHFRWNLVGDPEEMTTAIAYAWDGDLGDGQALADDLAQTFPDGWGAANMSPQWSWRGVIVYVGQAGDPVGFESNNVTDGTHAAQGSIPNNCSYIIKKTTAQTGVRFRGRMYLPPIAGAEDAISNTGMLTEDLITGLVALSGSWFDEILSVDHIGEAVLLHAPSELSATPSPTPITGFLLEPQIATQRRRMR